MSTELIIPDEAGQLTRFVPTDSEIAAMAAEYMPLTIAGVEDSAGYKAVHAARMNIKGKRVNVEKVRRELKADALEYGRKVDAEAKRITALLEPIEFHLENEEEAYEKAKEAIRNEAMLKAEAEARAKAEAEAARLKAERDAEEARLKAARDAEEARLRAEREKIEAERRVMETERAAEAAKRKAEQDKIDDERRVLDAERKRLADIEAARIRAEAERLAAIEKKAADEARAAAKEVARLKAEALRPDRDKLASVADALAAIRVPEVSADAQMARDQIVEAIRVTVGHVGAIVAGMVPDVN